MKLNLLPATVSRGKQARTAWIFSILLIFIGIGISVALSITSAADLKQAIAEEEEARPAAQAAFDTSQKADAVMAQADVQALLRNIALAEAMNKHNDDYPALYNSLKRYIPPYFRLTSLSAQPIDATTATVTMTGTLSTYQQYADLMLTLMRNPKAKSIARAGYQEDEPIVPNLTQADQVGAPRKPGEQPLPKDPLERLAFFANQPRTDVYTGVGNFGTGTDNTRGAMPGESLVTVTMTVEAPIQTPDPRQTLAASAGAGGAPGGAPQSNVSMTESGAPLVGNTAGR